MPRCADAGLALCDDFEQPGAGGAPDPSKWRVITSYSGQPSMQNRVTIDAEHVARGSHALHVHTETQDPVYLETLQLPIRNNGFYGRVLAYFAADPGARSQGHWGAFVALGKKDAQGQDVEVRIGGQFDILVVNYSPTDALQLSSSRDGYYDDGVKLPVERWTCFEFQLAGASDELRVWMDGAEISACTSRTGTSSATAWSRAGRPTTTACASATSPGTPTRRSTSGTTRSQSTPPASAASAETTRPSAARERTSAASQRWVASCVAVDHARYPRAA